MKTNLKILGIIFMSIGGFIGLFVLGVLVSGSLMGLGIIQSDEKMNFASALVVFFVLAYPALWIAQTGYALFKYRMSGRLSGIVLASVLLIGLNVILLLLKDQPGKARNGIVTFHALMILMGIYALIVLVPGRVKEFLQ
jgi:hypothetical protein